MASPSRGRALRSVAMVLAVLAACVLAIVAPRHVPRTRTGVGPIAAARSGTATVAGFGVRATLTAGDLTVTRTLPALAFTLRPGESLDPRLPPGTFHGTFEVTFDPRRDERALFGAVIRGGQLRIRRASGEEIHSDATGDETRRTLSNPITPVRLARHRETVVYEFRATQADRTVVLRALWQPEGSAVPLPLPSAGAPLLDDPALRGLALARRLNCARCHRSADETLQTRLTREPPPNLGRVGARVRPSWVRRWVRDPGSIDPGAPMPGVSPPGHRGDAWIEDVVHFLVSLGGPIEDGPRAPDPSDVGAGRTAFHRVGCFACHGPLDGDEGLPEGALPGPAPWRAYASIEAAGAKTTIAALAAFLHRPLDTHPSGTMPDQDLTEAEALAIASYLFARGDEGVSAEDLARDADFTVDPARVARGRAAFAAAGCANCHEVAPAQAAIAPTRTAAPLESLASSHDPPAGPDRGCLSADPPPGAARYDLAADQRADLRAFLASLPERRINAVPIDDLLVDVSRYGCTYCHAFDSALGPEAAVWPYFVTRGEADLGDEGRMPPTLTDAGARATGVWMHEALAGVGGDGESGGSGGGGSRGGDVRGVEGERGGRARPYLAVRMPSFGAANVERLPGLFAAAAGASSLLDEAPAFSADRAAAGRVLVGSGGLACIQCHTIAGRESTGTPGPDLALMTGRLHYEFFSRWLHDPDRVRPGTRMPRFFPGGVSSAPQVLGGDATAQVEAIWSYLSQGEDLPLPRGLPDPAGMELVVGREPIVFRTFMRDAGVRAIACGFPEQVHCAFDADRCEVTAIWLGRFLSAQGAWGARGGTETNPKEVAWTPPKTPLLIIEDAPGGADASTTTTTTTTTRFHGYRLDAERRPIFEYDLVRGGVRVQVEDFPRPAERDGVPGLVQRIAFHGPPGVRIGISPDDLLVSGRVEQQAGGSGAVLRLDDAGDGEIDLTWKQGMRGRAEGRPERKATERLE